MKTWDIFEYFLIISPSEDQLLCNENQENFR